MILPKAPTDSLRAATVNGRLDAMNTVMSPAFVLRVESSIRFPESSSARMLPAAVEALSSYKIEKYEDNVRLYVDDGAVAIPQILRALDAAGVTLDTIELHRPSLDDVFLTKTGRTLA